MTATTTDNSPNDGPPPPSAPTDADRYLDAVRAELADLESEEIEELTDDLQVQLAELSLESDGSPEPFDQVLGPPAAFAAELRQSAGFGPRTTPVGAVGGGTIGAMVGGLRNRIGAQWRSFSQPILDTPFGREVADFLPELRPGWWVLRGYLFGVLVGLITSVRALSLLGVPKLFDNVILGFFVTLGFIVTSVRWGRSGGGSMMRRIVTGLAGLLAVLAALVIVDQESTNDFVEVPAFHEDGGFIGDEDGGFIGDELRILPANIYAYLPDGTPLEQVLLFNEDGEPINLPNEGYSERLGESFMATPRVDLDGDPVVNLYPRQLEVYNLEQNRFVDADAPRVGFPYLVDPAAEDEEPVPEPSTSTTPTTSTPSTTESSTTESSTTSTIDESPSSTAEGEGS